MVPFFDVIIPFIDDSSISGYFITLLFQLVLCIVVISIMYSVDYVFILTTFTGTAIIDLIEEDCKALTRAIHNSVGDLVENNVVNELLLVAVNRNQEMRRLVLASISSLTENRITKHQACNQEQLKGVFPPWTFMGY